MDDRRQAYAGLVTVEIKLRFQIPSTHAVYGQGHHSDCPDKSELTETQHSRNNLIKCEVL